jgi:hypothetical protein
MGGNLRPFWPARRVGLWAKYVRRLTWLQRDFLRESHERRHGADSHFSHHPTAVDLNSLLDSAKVGSDLLVKASSDDVR